MTTRLLYIITGLVAIIASSQSFAQSDFRPSVKDPKDLRKSETSDCARAKGALTDAANRRVTKSVGGYDLKEIAALDCSHAITLALLYTDFKTDADLEAEDAAAQAKSQADRETAKAKSRADREQQLSEERSQLSEQIDQIRAAVAAKKDTEAAAKLESILIRAIAGGEMPSANPNMHGGVDPIGKAMKEFGNYGSLYNPFPSYIKDVIGPQIEQLLKGKSAPHTNGGSTATPAISPPLERSPWRSPRKGIDGSFATMGTIKLSGDPNGNKDTVYFAAWDDKGNAKWLRSTPDGASQLPLGGVMRNDPSPIDAAEVPLAVKTELQRFLSDPRKIAFSSDYSRFGLQALTGSEPVVALSASHMGKPPGTFYCENENR